MMLSPSRCEKNTVGIFEEGHQFALGRETFTVPVFALQTGILLLFFFFCYFSLIIKDPIQILSIFMRVSPLASLLSPIFVFIMKYPDSLDPFGIKIVCRPMKFLLAEMTAK